MVTAYQLTRHTHNPSRSQLNHSPHTKSVTVTAYPLTTHTIHNGHCLPTHRTHTHTQNPGTISGQAGKHKKSCNRAYYQHKSNRPQSYRLAVHISNAEKPGARPEIKGHYSAYLSHLHTVHMLPFQCSTCIHLIVPFLLVLFTWGTEAPACDIIYQWSPQLISPSEQCINIQVVNHTL